MKIIINTASTFEGGAIQVAVSFIEECRKIKDHEYHVILGVKLKPFINQRNYPANFSFYEIDYRPATRIFSIKLTPSIFSQIEEKVKPDVVFTTSGPAYWKPKVPHLCGFNIPQNVYPESVYFQIIPLKKRIKWNIDRIVRRYYFRRDGKDFVVQTDDINSRLRFWFRTENVTTVSNTCSSYYINPQIFPLKLPVKQPGEFRFFTFSTFRPHKNHKILKEVIKILPANIKSKLRFVITIPEKDYSLFFSREEKNFIINVGPVKMDEGPSLYKECDAVILPTLLECFSAAYPEAMAMQKPILTSDLSFARSICQNAALFFNPLNAADISEKIINIIKSTELQRSLIEKGKKRLVKFGTAVERAKAYIRLLEKLVNN
jgi:glycosyltransferase involved in cell wall biosynthesis